MPGLRRLRVELKLPIRGNPSAGSRDRLLHRVMRRRREAWTRDKIFGPIVEEPVFTGLEARDDGVACLASVLGRMLSWGIVAASDVPTLGAAS
jgi:hypothetical protein